MERRGPTTDRRSAPLRLSKDSAGRAVERRRSFSLLSNSAETHGQKICMEQPRSRWFHADPEPCLRVPFPSAANQDRPAPESSAVERGTGLPFRALVTLPPSLFDSATHIVHPDRREECRDQLIARGFGTCAGWPAIEADGPAARSAIFAASRTFSMALWA